MRSRRWLRSTCSLILKLYPGAWRARYGVELENILDHREVTASTVLDLTVSALHAHRHPEVGSTEALSMTARARPSLASVLFATLAFAVAWGLVLNVRVTYGGAWIRSVHQDADLAVKVVGLTGAAGLFAILAGSVVLLASDGGRVPRRRSLIRPFGLVILALAAFVGLFAAAATAINSSASGTLWPFAIAGWAVAVAVVARGLAHASPDPRPLHAGLRIVRLGVVGMAVAAAGGVWVGVAVSTEVSAIGPQVSAIGPPILPIFVMVCATIWAAVAFRRGLEGMEGHRPA